jgi:malonate decarboxylase gamma subunit
MSGSLGNTWFACLTGGKGAVEGYPASVQVADAAIGDSAARYIAVVPDAGNRFPRARNGEMGLLEGWHVARAIREAMQADGEHKRAIVAVIDVPSQAYGRREEAYGIHQALAASAAAYAEARLAGHPVIGLIVGKAISGGFLAHGYQANRLIAFDSEAVTVHAMGKQSAARITLRSVEALESLAADVPPMAYDVKNFATLGLRGDLLKLEEPGRPGAADQDIVRRALARALEDIRQDPGRGLTGRQGAPNRAASARVRESLRRDWAAPS